MFRRCKRRGQRGVTLLEAIIALGIGGLVLAGAAWYLKQFNSMKGYTDRKASTRADVVQTGAFLESVFARRNVSLDLDASPATVSLRLVKAASPEIHIWTRSKPGAPGDTEYTFYNECSPRSAGLPALPPGPLGSCSFACPPGQQSSVMLRVTEGGATKTRPLVAADPSGKAGTAADARLCIVTPSPNAPGFDLAWAEFSALPYGEGTPFAPMVQAAEPLTEALRDPNVEFTSRD